MADVFLSYNSKDRAAAQRVQQALSRRGIDVFWDQETPPGQDWDTWTRSRLAEAKVVVVLWSKTSVASDSVRHEAMLARKANKLLPAVIDSLVPEDLPMGLYMVQSVIVSDWDAASSQGMARLVAEVEGYLTGKAPAAAPQSRLERILPSPNSKARMALYAGLAGVALLGAGVWWMTSQIDTTPIPSAPQIATIDAALTPDADGKTYSEAQTCDQLKAYLAAYPEGKFKADATKRVEQECAPKPTPAKATAPVVKKPKPQTETKPPEEIKPAAVAAPPADPCTQARADWTGISNTEDLSVLRTFISGAPSACTIQRAQAQSRIDTLQAAAVEKKRVAWNGVPDFDGVWVLDASAPNAGCGNFPWRYTPNGQMIRRVYPNGGYRDLKVIATSPPTLRVDQNNKGAAIIEGHRQKIINQDGKLDCYLVRQ